MGFYDLIFLITVLHMSAFRVLENICTVRSDLTQCCSISFHLYVLDRQLFLNALCLRGVVCSHPPNLERLFHMDN